MRRKIRTRKCRRLRQLRRAREMSMETLGARVGLDKVMICNIEWGKRDPSLKKAELLAAEFGVSIEEAFSFVEIPA